MSRLAEIKKFLREAPWQMWTAQTASVVGIELKRNLWRRRTIWLYILTLAPVLLIAGHALHSPFVLHCNLDEDTRVFADIFQLFYLRLGIFFSCMGLFTWLFRGEVVQKSLHYYFLSPLRREVLVVGKFLAGLIITAVAFGISVLLSFALMYVHFGQPGIAYVLHGPGVGQLGA